MNHTEEIAAADSRLARVRGVDVLVAAPTAPARSSRWPAAVLVITVVVGVAVRFVAFASDRPLWLDEAMIAMNLTDRSVGQLFEPLDRNQSAPVAFLLAGKLCITLFGPTEHALRLPALVGSILGLIAFAVAAVRLLPPWTARLAVLLFAMSPTVISYAAEVKQYSTDAAVTAGLLALAAPLWRTVSRGRLIALGVGGAAAVWVAHPAVFVLAAIGLALFIPNLFRREYPTTVTLAVIGAAWLASFAGVYWVNVRFGTANGYLADYWGGSFLPLDASAIPWLCERWVDFFRTPGGFGGVILPFHGLAAVLSLVGGLFLWRDGRRAETAALAAMFVATLVASALEKYPFMGRLLMFLVPAGVVLTAHGTRVLAGLVWRRSRAAAVLLVGAVVISPAVEVARQTRHPDRTENVPAVLDYVREHWRSGDRLYVYNGRTDVGAGPAFEFYTRVNRFPDEAVTLGGEYRKDARGYQVEVNALAATPGRVWVLFSHQHADEQAWVRAYFDAVADRGDEFRDPGRGPRATAFLYTIR